MFAEITAYKGRICIELKTHKSVPGAVITALDNPRFPGHAVLNSGQNLGVSSEAIVLLEKIVPGRFDFSDLNWTSEENGTAVFGWKGERCAIFSPEACQASLHFKVRSFVTIPNRVPFGAQKTLDRLPMPETRRVGMLTGEIL